MAVVGTGALRYKATVDERTAYEEARRRNAELGDRGVNDAFFVEVEEAPGEWIVELRREEPEKRSWPGRIIDALFSSPWP